MTTLSFAEVDARAFVEPISEFVRTYLVPGLTSDIAIFLICVYIACIGVPNVAAISLADS